MTSPTRVLKTRNDCRSPFFFAKAKIPPIDLLLRERNLNSGVLDGFGAHDCEVDVLPHIPNAAERRAVAER